MIAPIAAASGPAASADVSRRAQLQETADAFEAILLRQMIGAMRGAALAPDDLAGASSGQFRDMMDARLADVMAGSSRLGIAEAIMAQFDSGAAPAR